MADIELGSIEIKTGANTSDKFKLPYNVLADPPDLSVYAKLAENNTFTGGQTITGANNGYSINASGYIKGSWLQASAPTNKGSNTGKVCVFDNAGWIYYRTPAEILTEAGGAKASDIPDVSGKANLNGGNTFNGQQIFKNTNSGAVAECVMNNSAWDSFTVRNVSDNTKKSAISSGYVWCQDNDNVYSQFKPTGIYYGNDTSGYEGTLAFPTGISGTKTIATTDELANKANLLGGNNFEGSQSFSIDTAQEFQINNADSGIPFLRAMVTNGNGELILSANNLDIQAENSDTIIACDSAGFHIDRDQMNNVAVVIGGDAGTSGQVLTSQGSGNSPIWTSPAIKSATLSGTTLYLTLS